MTAPTEHFCSQSWTPERPIRDLVGGWQPVAAKGYSTDQGDKEVVPAEGTIPLCWMVLHPAQELPGADKTAKLAPGGLLLWDTTAQLATGWQQGEFIQCETLMKMVLAPATAGLSPKRTPPPASKPIKMFSWGVGGILLVAAMDHFLFLGLRHSTAKTKSAPQSAAPQVVLYYKNGPDVSEWILGDQDDPKPSASQWVYLGLGIHRDPNTGKARVGARYCVSKTAPQKIMPPNYKYDPQDWRPYGHPPYETELEFLKVRAGLACFFAASQTAWDGHFARFHLWKPEQ